MDIVRALKVLDEMPKKPFTGRMSKKEIEYKIKCMKVLNDIETDKDILKHFIKAVAQYNILIKYLKQKIPRTAKQTRQLKQLEKFINGDRLPVNH